MDSERVELGGAVLDGLRRTWGAQMTAFGSREEAPFIVSFSEEGEPFEAVLPGHGSVTSVAGWERSLVVTDDGQRPELFEVSTPDDGPLRVELNDVEFTESARHGLAAAKRVWAACGGEDPTYVVMDSTGWLQAIDSGVGDWMPGGLRLGSPDQHPLVNQGDVSLLFAGRFASKGADPAAPSMWTFDEDGAQQINTHVRFTEVSDISDGHAAWFAGSLNGQPQLVSTHGDLGPVPDVELDPISPTVLVATNQYTHDPESLRLVLQTVDGIQLWTSTSQGWLHEVLPGNVLQAARYDDASSSLWVIADHELWRATN